MSPQDLSHIAVGAGALAGGGFVDITTNGGASWTDVDLVNRQITVARSIACGVVGTPKSNKIRHIPMTADLTSALGAVRRPDGLVFQRGTEQHLQIGRAHV